jgi:hypothetical protein
MEVNRNRLEELARLVVSLRERLLAHPKARGGFRWPLNRYPMLFGELSHKASAVGFGSGFAERHIKGLRRIRATSL